MPAAAWASGVIGVNYLFYLYIVFVFVRVFVFGSLVRICHFHEEPTRLLILLVWQGWQPETTDLARAMYQFRPTSEDLRRQLLQTA